MFKKNTQKKQLNASLEMFTLLFTKLLHFLFLTTRLNNHYLT